jgi:phosphatidylglycerophosphate synthase
MFDEPFRARFQPVIRPLAHALGRRGIAPVHVTVAAFLIGAAAAVLIAFGRPYLGLATWLLSRVGDGLDGTLARETNQTTPFGGYLDITLDMAAYSAVVVAFAVVHPHLGVEWAMVLAGYVLVITTTLALSDAAGVLGRQVSETDRTFQFTPGFAEAGETNIVYGLLVLFPEYVRPVAWIWIALLAATVAQRTYAAARMLR